MAELTGKTILVGVSGGIAAYKMPNLVSMLVQKGADVHVLLTENAKNIIPPLPFEALTGNRCLTSPFERSDPPIIHHIALAKKADLMFIAPASADIIGKCANGIADDMLTSTILACQCPVYFAPAMNDRMYTNSIVQENMKKLEAHGFEIIQPAVGYLACGDTGSGKMPEPSVLFEYVLQKIALEKDLSGKKILVTAGPTREPLDPVRFLTNHSTGKMGYALAKIAAMRGAEVTLVSGPVELQAPLFVRKLDVTTAREMFETVRAYAPEQDIIIKAAAVADYRPVHVSSEKVKKSDGELEIPMERTDDILKYLGEHKREGQFLCGFSMETENMLENSRRKLEKKNLYMIVANNLKTAGAGFGTDTNVVTILTEDETEELPVMSKEEVAQKILDQILSRIQQNG